MNKQTNKRQPGKKKNHIFLTTIFYLKTTHILTQPHNFGNLLKEIIKEMFNDLAIGISA